MLNFISGDQVESHDNLISMNDNLGDVSSIICLTVHINKNTDQTCACHCMCIALIPYLNILTFDSDALALDCHLI